MLIQDLIDLAAEAYPFDVTAYPEIESYTDKKKMAFAISHQALHFAKNTGKIASLAEEIDHAKTGFTTVRRVMLEQQLAAMFINVLRMADTINLNEDDLMRLATERLESFQQ